MISFREETRLAAQRLIEMAFEEDLQDVGDLTTQATIIGEQQGSVAIVARDDGRLSGGVLIRLVYEALATRYPGDVAVEDLLPDGS
ncbi:MAG TPA: nicotinate-nucleotide diphosphorylase (carboxylating), partial [Planctomycetaceae bacterium]|nr:nicotinate-nucleotide diphosphorylase (carboxylating) [Planctomycetaceae bacterium]